MKDIKRGLGYLLPLEHEAARKLELVLILLAVAALAIVGRNNRDQIIETLAPTATPIPTPTLESTPNPDGTFSSNTEAQNAAKAVGCQLSLTHVGEIEKRASEGNPMKRWELEVACDFQGSPDDYQYYAGLTETNLPLGNFADSMFNPDGKIIGKHTHKIMPSTENCGFFGQICMFNRWERDSGSGLKPMGGTVFSAVNRGHEGTFLKNPGPPRR